MIQNLSSSLHNTSHQTCFEHLTLVLTDQQSARIITMTLLILMVVPTSLLNAVALSAFLRKDQLVLPSNIHLLNTSFCDFMVGVAALPLWISHFTLMIFFSKYNCFLYAAHTFMGNLLPWITLVTTFLIAVDRHVAIFNPYFYAGRVQGKKVLHLISVSLAWIIMCAVNSINFFVSSHRPLCYLSWIMPILIGYCIFVHVRACLLVRRVHRIIGSLSVALDRNVHQKHATAVRHSKVARLTSLMLGSLCICYLPSFGFQIRHFFYEPSKSTYDDITRILALLKCLINPFLYYKSKSVFRRQLRSIFRRVRAYSQTDRRVGVIVAPNINELKISASV